MNTNSDTLRHLLLLLGFCLIATGGLLLLWFGHLVFQIVTEPENVRIVEFILENIIVDEPLISGHMADSEFEITLSESGRTFGFFILGIFALGILSGILNTLLTGGVEIMKWAMSIRKASAPQ